MKQRPAGATGLPPGKDSWQTSCWGIIAQLVPAGNALPRRLRVRTVGRAG